MELYLAVNKDGTEVCSNEKLVRTHEHMMAHSTPEYQQTHPVDVYENDYWADTITDTDYGYFGYCYSFDGVELPKGFIKKLIGINLSYNDEPIRIEFQDGKEL